MVSPPDKSGNDVVGPLTTFSPESFAPYGSFEGDAVAYTSYGAFPNVGSNAAPLYSTFLARREVDGWVTEGISPPQDPEFAFTSSFYNGFSDDLSFGAFKSASNPPLTPDAEPNTLNYYVRHNSTGAYRLMGKSASGNLATRFGGASENFDHVAFNSEFALTPDSPAGLGSYAYDWSASSGALSFLGYQPDENPVTEEVEVAAAPHPGGATVDSHSVSDDGSRIFFETQASASEHHLYVRIDGATTKDVSGAVPDPKFQMASSTGSRAFFTSDPVFFPETALYLYDVDANQVTNLTPLGSPRVTGLLGTSNDGTRVYFVARGVLAPGATDGADNLYLWIDDGSPVGTLRFVSTGVTELNYPRGSCGSEVSVCYVYGRVTPDGMHVLFESSSSLTGYPSNGKFEVYVYSGATEEVECASCNPSNAPATHDALASGVKLDRHARTISADGRWVFFNTEESLVPSDSNGFGDVYRYDTQTDDVALLSSGTSASSSEFSDASADGSNAFFVTRQRLVGPDFDSNLDVYDARVGGGFLESENRAVCQGEECRAQRSEVPSLAQPASTALVGKGNVRSRRNARCGKHARKVRRKGKTRCVKRHRSRGRAHREWRAGR